MSHSHPFSFARFRASRSPPARATPGCRAALCQRQVSSQSDLSRQGNYFGIAALPSNLSFQTSRPASTRATHRNRAKASGVPGFKPAVPLRPGAGEQVSYGSKQFPACPSCLLPHKTRLVGRLTTEEVFQAATSIPAKGTFSKRTHPGAMALLSQAAAPRSTNKTIVFFRSFD